MRGFRGNRAVINFKSALLGEKQYQRPQFQIIHGNPQDQGEPSVQKKQLPDWLKLSSPETKPRGATKGKKSAKVVAKRRKAA